MVTPKTTGAKRAEALKIKRLRAAASALWVNESVPDIEDLGNLFEAKAIPDEFKQWLGVQLGEYRSHFTATEQRLTRREIIEHLKSLSSNIKATRLGLTHIPPESFAHLATSQHKLGSNDFEMFQRVAKELISVQTHVEIVLKKFTEEHDSAGRGDVKSRDLLIHNVSEKLRPALVSKTEVALRITHEILTRAGVAVPAIGSMKASAQKGKEIHLQKG